MKEVFSFDDERGEGEHWAIGECWIKIKLKFIQTLTQNVRVHKYQTHTHTHTP